VSGDSLTRLPSKRYAPLMLVPHLCVETTVLQVQASSEVGRRELHRRAGVAAAVGQTGGCGGQASGLPRRARGEPKRCYSAINCNTLMFQGTRRGCVHSRGVLALCLAWGAGCPKHAQRARQLAGGSAAAGSKYGHYALGALLFDDGGDDSRVTGLFRKAADHNLDAAQWGLGYLHETGVGVPQNWKEALHWHELAAEQGMSWACASVARIYEEGLGVLADEGRAVRWYTRAVNAGHFASVPALRRLKQKGKQLEMEGMFQ
jgi:TPR repeat protein